MHSRAYKYKLKPNATQRQQLARTAGAKYKADWKGKTVVQVDRWFPSSKLCSKCGHKNDALTLSDRQWICPGCGFRHDRDINAAVNLKYEGMRLSKDKSSLCSRSCTSVASVSSP